MSWEGVLPTMVALWSTKCEQTDGSTAIVEDGVRSYGRSMAG